MSSFLWLLRLLIISGILRSCYFDLLVLRCSDCYTVMFWFSCFLVTALKSNILDPAIYSYSKLSLLTSNCEHIVMRRIMFLFAALFLPSPSLGSDTAVQCTVIKKVDNFSFLHHPVHQRSLEILQRCKDDKYSKVILLAELKKSELLWMLPVKQRSLFGPLKLTRWTLFCLLIGNLTHTYT